MSFMETIYKKIQYEKKEHNHYNATLTQFSIDEYNHKSQYRKNQARIETANININQILVKQFSNQKKHLQNIDKRNFSP